MIPPTTTTVVAVEPAAVSIAQQQINTARAAKIALLRQAIAALKTALVIYETELARLLR
jgi:hypothetical protein